MSYLQQIQVATQQIAEAISSVLGMDVTIVDDQLVRIAGTGQHRQTIGQRIIGNSVYQRVLENMEECIITDVRTNDACEVCEKRSTCMELAQLCCPIVLGQNAIGIIGLIAFSHQQQLELANKGQHLLTFIEKMADLIAAKVVEKNSLNRLIFLKNQVETVLNFVAEGIVAIDHHAQIRNMNYAAEKMLGVKERDVLGFYINEVFPGTPIQEVFRDGVGFMDREVKVWHNGRHHHYLINAKPMWVDGQVQGVVASFRPALIRQPILSVAAKVTFDEIIGNSHLITSIKSEARKAACGASTVLIMGESGTGKEIFARAIHFEGERNAGPFIAVNCAAIPETLLESELFGYEEGSFTGAKKGGKPGKFQMADGGTLFLDEIGDMPLSLQVKMLRVLQEKIVERVGGIRSYQIDVRIIAATNRDLEELVNKGEFRQDLYYRLNVFPLVIPPLRERKDDILELTRYFLRKHAKAYHKEKLILSEEAEKVLLNYNWPGNIRELENAIECAVVKIAGNIIEIQDLPSRILTTKQKNIEINSQEKENIENALKLFGKSVEGKEQAAASLGIGIATLYRKIRKYGL